MKSGRRYIGLTSKKWQRRWSEHLSKARNWLLEKNHENHWYNALIKYGPDSFDHEVLQVCSSLEEANAAEKYWIELYDTTHQLRGFNTSRGGEHVPHPVKNPWERPEYIEKAKQNNNIRHCLTPEARAKQIASLNTPESRAKRSQKTRESMASPETQLKRAVMRANPEYGKKISDSLKSSLASVEARENMSRAAIESCTEEVRARLSEGTRRAFEDPAVKERHRIATTAAQNRPEVKEKQRNRTTSPETRAKISAASTGFRHTDESKEAMRRSFLERRANILSESGCTTWSEYIKLSIANNKKI